MCKHGAAVNSERELRGPFFARRILYNSHSLQRVRTIRERSYERFCLGL